jgi:hypothetical protein
MEAVDKLVAIEAIKQLKAQYFRSMDTKDWKGMRAVFADEARIALPDDDGSVHDDIDSFMVMLEERLGSLTTVHHGHMPQITVTSPTTATGIWAMEDLLRWPDGGPFRELHGFGHYHETYEKLDDEWRICTLTLTRLRVDVVAVEIVEAAAVTP